MKSFEDNKPATDLLVKQKEALQNGKYSIPPNYHLSFVCGGASDSSIRAQFLDFLNRQGVSDLIVVLAEKSMEEVLASDHTTFLNLSEFESLIAEILDCILIFHEIPGSFAELGYFAANAGIAQKSLVVNSAEFQDGSFINYGPVPHLNSASIYQPFPIILADDYDAGFATAMGRLIEKTTKVWKYKRRLHMKPFKESSAKQIFLVFAELLREWKIMSPENLRFSVKQVMGSYDVKKLNRIMAVLVAMGYVVRDEYGDYKVVDSDWCLLDSDEAGKISIDIIGYYQKHDPESLEAAGGAQ